MFVNGSSDCGGQSRLERMKRSAHKTHGEGRRKSRKKEQSPFLPSRLSNTTKKQQKRLFTGAKHKFCWQLINWIKCQCGELLAACLFAGKGFPDSEPLTKRDSCACLCVHFGFISLIFDQQRKVSLVPGISERLHTPIQGKERKGEVRGERCKWRRGGEEKS